MRPTSWFTPPLLQNRCEWGVASLENGQLPQIPGSSNSALVLLKKSWKVKDVRWKTHSWNGEYIGDPSALVLLKRQKFCIVGRCQRSGQFGKWHCPDPIPTRLGRRRFHNPELVPVRLVPRKQEMDVPLLAPMENHLKTQWIEKELVTGPQRKLSTAHMLEGGAISTL